MIGAKAVEFNMSDVSKEIAAMGFRVKAYPMSVIATQLAGDIEDLIQSEGDGQWEPLSPGTLRRHPRRAGGKLLQDKGFLANIQSSAGRDWAQAESPAHYAGFHVTGTKWMPQRDWTGINLSRFLERAAAEIINEAV